ncbi:response regulator [Brevundimonas bacteroides]|uniref:response regulator n=1 Tax=Brevundimonas bacteroides TaxID=74311 RepID=UPI000496D225|nr:response regulator [Brevundimonas bacteroides]
MTSRSDARINLKDVKVLCVDPTNQGLDILAAMLKGFGVEQTVRVHTAAEAKDHLARTAFDMVIADADLADESGFDLVRWLRRSTLDPNRYVPFIITSGQANGGVVNSARSCGASFVVAKPTSPAVLMRRILWVAAGGRQFVESPGYVGPDRRWKFEGPPPGSPGRRTTDQEIEVGFAREPNLSQDEINAVFKPQKISL